MIQPGRLDIGADRWVACIRTFSFLGLDLSAATFAAHIRELADGSGSPLVNLGVAATASDEGIRLTYSGTDTIANHIAADRLSAVPDAINPDTAAAYTAEDSVLLSHVSMRIHEATMEALPSPAEVGDDVELVWDMHITPSGGIKDKYLGGTFTVRAGVTQ